MNENIEDIAGKMLMTGRLNKETECLQHGNVTVFEHSVNVACLSIAFADRLPVAIDRESLIKGALLHDYFLYDWHDKSKSPGLHGLKHPYIAMRNAAEDYELNDIEKDIILRHMFPLTPIPPRYAEAWIVCIADKCCALTETVEWRLKNVFPAGV